MALIDLPFTRGIDQSADETATPLPAMVELVNYRLTRAGRLEHRLGVKEVPVDDPEVTSASPEGELAQAVSGRLLAAGGRLFSRGSGTASWSCVGSVSRFVPWGSQVAHVDSGDSYVYPSCAAAGGKAVVIGTRNDAAGVSPKAISVRVLDIATGATVWTQTVGITTGTPENHGRVVCCGNRAVIVFQDVTTGNIYATSADVSAVPFVAFPAQTSLVAAVSGVAGFDACPIDANTYAVSYWSGGSAFLSIRNATTHAQSTLIVQSANTALTTCQYAVIGGQPFYFLAWTDTVSLAVRVAVYNAAFALVGSVQTVATGLTDTYRPVMCEASDQGGVIVGYTDRYTSGASYETVQTSFALMSSTGVAVVSYSGPYYGFALGSKPFNPDSAFTAGARRPAVWLVNAQRDVGSLDRSYFMIQLRQGDPARFAPLEMSAAPSRGPIVADVMAHLSETVTVTSPPAQGGQKFWLTALLESFRGVGTTSPQMLIRLHQFGDAAESTRSRARAVIPSAGSDVILGGYPRYFDGSWATEVGMPYGPAVNAAAAASGGSMDPSKTYRYVFVLEYYDAKGQRHLSYVSTPYSVTLGAGDSAVDFEIQVPYLWASANADIADTRQVTLRVYRTAGDTGTVFRFCPLLSRPYGSPGGPYYLRVTGTDTLADADIAANEAIYVQVGNALSNYRAPACRFGCEHEGRLVVGGGWSPNTIHVSKLFFPGEGIQFTESASFLITVPEDVTACASLDGSLVLFSKRGIYVVSGDGPTDDGVGSFTPPRRLPGRVGCLDWRSVVVTEQGVMFRGAEGVYLLPRGLGSPVFIGAHVRETMRLYPETLGSAVVTRSVTRSVSDVDSEQIATWLIGDEENAGSVKALSYNLATQAWAELEWPSELGNAATVMGTWSDIAEGSDTLAMCRRELTTAQAGSFLVEATGADYGYDISPSFEPLLSGSWKTGKLFPFGFGGRGSIRSIRIVGECLWPTTITPTVWHDADTSGATQTTIALTQGRFAVEIPFRRRDLAWVQIRIEDPTTGSEFRGAGLRFNGLALDIEREQGLHRSAPGERST